ncbi:MAG TPA: GAF domain-containing protein [Candidatus Wallbacteria bacterium]|nr:GAF domain-containing protein [Candidatus Wallbacteria bacterium]
MKENYKKTLEILHENEQLKKEVESLKKNIGETETDLFRNKKGKKMLSLLNHMLEDKIQNMNLVNDVIANINTVEDVGLIWQEMHKIIQKTIDYDYAFMFLAGRNAVYFHSKRRVEKNFLDSMLNRIKETYKEMNPSYDITHVIEIVNLEEKNKAVLPSSKIEFVNDLISMPLTIKKETFGLVTLFSHKPRKLQEEQINNFLVIINNVVAFIQNAILYESVVNAHKSLARNVQSLKTLLDVTRAMSSGQMSYDKLIDYILDMAILEVGGDGGALLLVDKKNDELYIKSGRGLPEDVDRNLKIKLGTGTAGAAVFGCSPIISIHASLSAQISPKDYQNYTIKYFPPFGDYSERPNVRSGISVPIISASGALGVINVTSSIKVFQEADLETLMLFANQAANTITVSQLNLVEKQRINELVKLNEIGKALNSTLKHAEIFRLVMDALADLIEFSVGSFFIEEDASNYKLNIISQENLGSSSIDNVCSIVINAYGEMTKKTIPTENISIDYEVSEGYEDIDIKMLQIKSFLVVPLVIKGQISGLLNVNATAENAFTEDNMRTLSTFASQVAVAIENSRSYEQMEKKIKEMSMLFEVSRTLTSTLDLDNVLELIVSISAQLMEAKVAFLRLLDENTNELIVKASYGMPDNYFKTRKMAVNEGISGIVISTKEPVAIFNISESPEVKDQSYLKSLGLVSILSVPLIVKDRAIGVISCFFKKHHHFSQSEITLLQTLASHASVAIENAKLYGDMQKNYTSTITALSAAIDAKDHYTHGHSKNVMEYSVAIAQQLKLTKDEIETIRFAGLLHDIGKIGISEVILQKKSSLTDDEFGVISNHPKLGMEIMNKVDFLKKISPLTYHHHEKYDGTGYPDHLKGDDIPLGARILNLADSFDVMTTSRTYKTAMSFENAIVEVERCSGTQFDPKVVDAFKNVIKKLKIKDMASNANIADLIAAANLNFSLESDEPAPDANVPNVDATESDSNQS